MNSISDKRRDARARVVRKFAWTCAWCAVSVLWNACALTTPVESDAATSTPPEATCDVRALHYERCSGPAGSQADCQAGQICGGMAEVGFTYCMPRPPCAPDMVAVIDLACAYPCSEAAACNERGLRACAVNTLAQSSDGPDGWCTP